MNVFLMDNKPITTVLMDADGVMIASAYLELTSFGIDSAILQPFFNSQTFKNCLVGIEDLRDCLPSAIDEWAFPGTLDELLDYWFTSQNDPNKILEDAVATLRSNDVDVYLATNQEKYRLAYMREAMGYNNLFSGVFCSCEIGVMKPNVQFFEYILTELNIPGESVLYWDDSASHIEGAKQLNINAHLFKDTDTCLQKLQDTFSFLN